MYIITTTQAIADKGVEPRNELSDLAVVSFRQWYLLIRYF